MSLFVSSNCQIPSDTAVNQLAWGCAQQIAALSSYSIDDNDRESNLIHFTNNEGELVGTSDIVHDFEATSCEWHPTEKLVAVGWADGLLTIMFVDGKSRPVTSYSNRDQHHSPITVVKWNPSGKRLVTGDKKGVVNVWSCDSRGILTVLRQYRKKGEITAVIYCTLQLRVVVDNQSAPKGKADLKSQNFSPSFFFGTDRGLIVFADDLGHCTDVHQLSSAIDNLLYFEEKSRLVVITRSLLLTQYHVADDGKVSRVMQVKISVSSDVSDRGIRSICWAGPGTLAAATEERMIRFFDLITDESYNISLSSALGGYVDRTDRVVCVSFSPVDRYLAMGTQAGIVAVWKLNGSVRTLAAGADIQPTSQNDWELIFRTSLNAPVMQLQWQQARGCLGVVTEEDTVILNESILNAKASGDMLVVQDNSHELFVYTYFPSEPKLIDAGISIRGVAVGRSCFVVWSGKLAKVYRVDPQIQRIDSFDPIKTQGVSMAIADASFIVDEAWFIAEGASVRVLNFMGTQKGLISFSEAEGTPIHIDVNGKYLAIITTKGCLKVADIHTPTKPKMLGSAGEFSSVRTASAQITRKVRGIKVNSAGNMVAILCDQVEGPSNVHFPDTNLYVYDRNKGVFISYDFAQYGRYPASVCWDESDDRLFICEAHRSGDTTTSVGRKTKNALLDAANAPSTAVATGGAGEAENRTPREVYLLFATAEQGILMQDSLPSEDAYGPLIGLTVPRIYYRKVATKKPSKHSNKEDSEYDSTTASSVVVTKVMRDFVGIENITDTIKTALLDFSFFLTLGRLDEAYRVVKEIDSPAIWENMAQMCVKTKRLDVAEVCLGNMGHARGAAAVRESKKEGNVEVSIGILAVQLGLLDDAAKLFREAGRYDLLNNLYQAAGLWDKAIETAESKDRIHLKSTHYHYAKYLENIGRIPDAVEHYQYSDNARTEVPRMLFHLGKVDELGDYVMQSEDAVLLKWWAAYLESIDRLDKARKFYSKAKDYLSLVRIYCFKGDFPKAVEIIMETTDRASAYHFARQMENQGEFQEAIRFYAMSGCYNHSIRLARAHHLDSELMRFALKSTPALMIECAQHFENKDEVDKAVQLYHKGGDIPRALELCFRIGEDPKHPHAAVAFDMLNTIAQDLGADSSPQTLARCADFLVQNRQYEKAIDLYVMAKRYLAAIDMCLLNRVVLSEEMVEKLTPSETALDASERKEILKDVAKALKKQGAFTLASKKYTQAGDRVRAIKCLVRSGDTKAVIQFATISRNAEIYTLAANYLQQMNWRESMEIMKAIILFYSKAKAYIPLAGFYDSCAQVEIDEYRDYEKAASALNEALKHLGKDTSRTAMELAKNIQKRLLMIEKYIEAKTVMKKDPSTMIAICEALIQDPMIEEALRVGDCYALLIEHFHRMGNMQDAYHYLREMEERQVAVASFLDAPMIDAIMKGVGVNNNATNAAAAAKTSSQSNKQSSSSKQQSLAMQEEEDDLQFLGGNMSGADGRGRGGGGKGGGGDHRGGSAGAGSDQDEVGEEINEDIEEEEEEVRPKGGKSGFVNNVNKNNRYRK